jgi:squalene-hopene/tetraprenyl-beta-curcumene cyclase
MPSPVLADGVRTAVSTAAEALFARRRPDGVFGSDTLRASPQNTAVALTALHFADPSGSAAHIERGVAWLRDNQRPDGGWAMPGVPTEPLATALVTSVLSLLGADATVVRAGEDCLARLGGLDAIGEPMMIGLARQFSAYAGAFDEQQLRRLPLELLLFGGLSRRLMSLRLPIFAAQALAQAVHRRSGPVRRLLNRFLRAKGLAPVRQAYERGGATGGFSTDPWLTSLICIGLARSGQAADIVGKSAEWLRESAHEDGHWDLMPLDVTWSQFAARALIEAGYTEDGRLSATRRMFHQRQNSEPFEAFACPPGYWGFSSAESWPMALETAEVSSLLVRLPGGSDDDHARRGIDWLTAVQDGAGSWSLAVRDSKPGGFGPCPYMTAQAASALLDTGAAEDDPRVAKALGWLIAQQDRDGSFDTLWYRGHTPGTSVVLEVLSRTGFRAHNAAAKAQDWLLRTRLDDGSWGTVEETAWAVRALLASGLAGDHAAVRPAIEFLLAAQRPDGTWPGGPVNEYVRFSSRYADSGIATGLALRALAAYRTASRKEQV